MPERPAWSDTTRPRAGVVLTTLAGIGVVVLCADAALRGRWDLIWRMGPWLFVGVQVIALSTCASFVRVEASQVTVQNVLRRHVIPWAQVTDVRLRGHVVLELVDGRRVPCYGAPSLARPALRTDGTDMHRGPVFAFVAALRRTWADDRGSSDTGVRTSWDVPPMIVLSGSIVLALACSALVR